MIKLTNIIKEIQGKTLHVYDFDDTLVKTETPIVLVNKDGSRENISSHEFATHQLQPDQSYDFGQFDAIVKSSQPILRNLKQIIASLQNPQIKTTVLTARRLAFPIMKHLRDKYGVDVYVIGVGSSDPEKKADWIENQVQKGYTKVKFMDDSEKNLQAVKNRLANYPEVQLDLINSLK
jgi:hypothetical protein